MQQILGMFMVPNFPWCWLNEPFQIDATASSCFITTEGGNPCIVFPGILEGGEGIPLL